MVRNVDASSHGTVKRFGKRFVLVDIRSRVFFACVACRISGECLYYSQISTTKTQPSAFGKWKAIWNHRHYYVGSMWLSAAKVRNLKEVSTHSVAV